MMVVLVALEVLVQVIDASGQQSDLYFGGTGVAFMAGVGLHNFSLVDHSMILLLGGGAPYQSPRAQKAVGVSETRAHGSKNHAYHCSMDGRVCKHVIRIFCLLGHDLFII